MNMSTGYKTWSPNYDTIKIHLLGEKNARTRAGAHTNTHSHLLESIRKLVHHSLWAGSFFKSQILITVLRTEYHSLHYQMPPLWKQTKRTARNSSFATDNWCLVSTERALFLFIFFVAFFLILQTRKQRETQGYCTFIFCPFQTRSAWEMIHALMW